MNDQSRQLSFCTASGVSLDVFEFDEIDYVVAQERMQYFAANRAQGDKDQIWLLQHPAIYTKGTACQQEPLIPSKIPVVNSDRGGQITYHGPGQIVMYPLLRLKNYGIGVKTLVFALEQAAINVLKEYSIEGQRREDAPGVYVDGAKIAALGLRIKRGTSYHGLSLNVDMDVAPFSNIDPCGYQGLKVTQIRNHSQKIDQHEIARNLVTQFVSLI